MLGEIYLLQLKSFLRSPNFQGDLIKKVLIGLGLLNILAAIAVLAWFLPEILRSYDPQNPSLELIFAQFFIFYLMIDLAVRFFFQAVPGFNYPHFALLPVDKRKLFSSLLILSPINLFNFTGILVVFPFFVRYIIPEFTSTSASLWLTGIVLALLLVHYLTIWIKIKLNSLLGKAIFMFLLISLIIGSSFFDSFTLMSLSAFFFGDNMSSGFTQAVFLILVIVLFFLSKDNLVESTHSEVHSSSTTKKESSLIQLTSKSNIIIGLFTQEVLLIMRNKRARMMVFLSIFLSVVYFYFIFYNNSQNAYMDEIMFFFYAFCMLGFWLFFYGQFLTAWESTFFDGLMALPIEIEDYLKAKWLILAVPVSAIYLLILIPLFLFFKQHLVLLTATWLLLTGPVSLMMLTIGIFNKKRVDINQETWFNNQGQSGTQLFLTSLVLLILAGITVPFYVLDRQMLGWIFWMLSGVLTIATYGFWIRKLAAFFMRKKQSKLENYRKKSG